MIVKIENDAFNISERIKEISGDYYVVYNTNQHRYEVHNSKQYGSTFCITCENGLNDTVIKKLRKTKIENIQRILDEIEENNLRLENDVKRVETDKASFKAREMFQYAKHHEDCSFDNSYSTRWC